MMLTAQRLHVGRTKYAGVVALRWLRWLTHCSIQRLGKVDHAYGCVALTATALLTFLPLNGKADQGLLPYNIATTREGEGDALVFAAYQLERYDSNFFRLPDGTDPPYGRRSVVTSTSGVGLLLDKSYGLQRITATASAQHDAYTGHSGLSFVSKHLDGTYFWSVTPAISGTLIFDYNRTPTDYEFIGFQTRPNPLTVRTTRVNVDWRAGAAIHPQVSVYETEYASERATFQQESSRSHGVQLSLIYDLRSGARAALYATRANGSNLSFVPNDALLLNGDFQQREYGVFGRWNVTGESEFDGRAGYTRRDHQTFAVRNFGGFIFALNYNYRPTGKTTLQLNATRNIYASQSMTSSYFREDIGKASVLYTATGKITITPSFIIRRQNYRAAPFPVAEQLRETSRSTNLQLDWAANRAVDISFLLSRSSRRSPQQILEFEDSNASVYARFRF